MSTINHVIAIRACVRACVWLIDGIICVDEGNVYTWGCNRDGQLGQGAIG
jgi:hypothetical protein